MSTGAERTGNERTTSCPREDQIEALLDPATAERSVEFHVESCSGCAAMLSEMRENEAFLDSVRSTRLSSLTPGSVARPDEISLPGYQVLSEIFRGGQGVVYEAIQIEAKRRVALKVLLAGTLATERQRRRFEREIEIAASLRHPHIVTLYERADLPDGRLAFSMEFIDGKPIDRWVAEQLTPEICGRSTLAVRAKLDLFVKVCDAVQHAHQRGITHRDLKPGNILVDHSGEPRVLDFGLARVAESADGEDATQAGEFLGSLAYASPEQVRGDPTLIDTRTDVYALGVVLYELLTGKHPYPSDLPIAELITNIATADPPSPRTVDRSIGSELDTIVLKAMAKDPDRRYRSAGALQQDIEHFLRGEPITAKHDSNWYLLRKTVKRHRTGVFIGAAFLVLIAGFVAWLSIAFRETRRGLRKSNIERAWAQLDLENESLAEDILWREHLAGDWNVAEGSLEHGADVTIAADSHWALRELYRRSRCSRTVLGVEGESGLCVAFDPSGSGTLAMSAGSNGRVILWKGLASIDTEPSQQVLRVGGDTRTAGPLPEVHYSPDGSFVVSGDPIDHTIRFWEVAFPEEVSTHTWRPSPVVGVSVMSFARSPSICVSPDGSKVGALGPGGSLTVFENFRGLSQGVTATSIPSPEPGANARPIRFARDSQRLYVVTGERYQRAWSVSWTGEPPEELLSSERLPVEALDFFAVHDVSSDGRWALIADNSGAKLFDFSERTTQPFSPLPMRQVRFARDGARIIGLALDRSIRIWNTRTLAAEPTILRGHANLPRSTTMAPDESALVSWDAAGWIKVWQLGPDPSATPLLGQGVSNDADPDDAVFDIAFTPDGNRFATASHKGNLIVRDSFTGGMRSRIDGPDRIASIAFCPWDPNLIAIGAHRYADAEVETWNVADGELERRMEQRHDNWVSGVVFSPTDRTVISSGGDGRVQVSDLATGTQLRELLPANRVRSVNALAMDPSGTWLVAGGREYGARFWIWDYPGEAKAMEVVADASGVCRAIAFGSDGLFAAGTDLGAIHLWRVGHPPTRVGVLEGDDQAVFSLCFNPSGTLLASGDDVGVIRIWDVASLRLLSTMETRGQRMFSLAFSPDGRRLVSGTDEATHDSPEHRATIWDLSYYDAAIAGNLDYQSQRLRAKGEKLRNLEALQEWAEGVRDERQ